MDDQLRDNSRFSRASHLTEFYPYLINNTGDLSPPKTSPTIYHTRTNSIANTIGTINTTTTLQSILTKGDIQKTSAIYDEILTASEEYRNSLSKVAETSANLGNSLEKLSKLKGSGDINSELLNFSGFFYLISNHEEILNQSIKQQFEIPITKEVNNFNLRISKKDEIFKAEYKQLLKELKQKEKENLKLSKSKTKSLNLYKSKLIQLTSHLESIEHLKQRYYQDSYDLVESSNRTIVNHLGTVIRAEIEIDENIARKGWSGGGLDDLISKCPDPFNTDDEELEEIDENENFSGNEAIIYQKDISSPSSPLQNGPVEDLRPLSSPHLSDLENQQANGNTTIKLPKTPDTSERLKHQQSVSSLTEGHLDNQSTPIASPGVPQIDGPEVKNNEENVSTIYGGDITDVIASFQIEDDNSFSLPLPESSNYNTKINDAIDSKDVLSELKESEIESDHEDNDYSSGVVTRSNQQNEWLQD